MNERPNESRRALVNNLCPGLSYPESAVERIFSVLDRSGFDAPHGEISVAFVSREEIARLHEDFMQDPTPTDVITFPGDIADELAGEICVCPAVAYDYAQLHGTDFSEEVTLYLAHGYLHLCGFDDRNDEVRAEMRRAETLAMQSLVAQDCVPAFAFEPS